MYFLADIIYFILYRIAGYRKKVVRKNLAESFPDKSAGELRRIEKRFYRNFADSLVETLRLMHVSDRYMSRHMQFENIELIDNLLDSGRSIIVYFAHTFNWEWAPSVSLHTKLKPSDKVEFGQVYRPLKSGFADRMMLKLRGRFHSICYPKSSTLRCLLKARKKGMLTITGFMSDQHPSHGDRGHLTTFLNHPTMMITGTETLARKLKMAAIYWDMEKTGRGKYKITVRPLADNVADTPEGEITEKYTLLLEQTIRRDPAIWLWSHKRWKRPVNLELLNEERNDKSK